MRHRKNFNHLGRTSSHRKALLANMASSLIMHKRISTTKAKARELRTYVEPLITKSKDDTTHSRRVVFSYLQNKDAVSELFREVSPKIINRPGGYTRILKTGTRLGDNADMCIIELVDYNENLLAAKEETQTGGRKRRSRRGKSGATPEKKEQEKAASVTEDKASAPEAEAKSEETEAPEQVAEVKNEEVTPEPASEEKEEEKPEEGEEKKEE